MTIAELRTVARPHRTGRPATIGFLVVVLACGGSVVWAFSYPGVPFSVLLVAFLLGLFVLGLGLRVARRPGPLGIAVSSLVLVLVAASMLISSGAPKQVRFAASQEAFAAVVAGVPVPTGNASDMWTTFSADCPAMIGSYTIADCRGFGPGYLFLQYDDAVTDDSGIAYLPAGLPVDADGQVDSGLTHLDGPWYAWTCNC